MTPEKEKGEPPGVEELAHRILLEVFCRCSSFLSHIGLLPCCISLPLDPVNDAEEMANLHRLQELVERNRHWIVLPDRNPGEKGERKYMKDSPAYVQKFRERFAENLTDSNLEGFFIYFYPENTSSSNAAGGMTQQEEGGGGEAVAAGTAASQTSSGGSNNNNPLRWVAGALVEYIDDGDAVLSFAFCPRLLSGPCEMELLLVTMSYAYLVFVRSMPYELPGRRRIPWNTPKLMGAPALYEALPEALIELDSSQTLPPPIGKINLSCRLTLDEQDLEICPRRLWDLMNSHFMQTGNHLEPNDLSEEGQEETLHSDQLDATKCCCHESSNIKQVYFFQSRDMIFRVFGSLVSQRLKPNRRKAKELDFFPHLPSEQLITELECLRFPRTAEEKQIWALMEIIPPKASEGAAAASPNVADGKAEASTESKSSSGRRSSSANGEGGGGGIAGAAGGTTKTESGRGQQRRLRAETADLSGGEGSSNEGKENSRAATTASGEQKSGGARRRLEEAGGGRGGSAAAEGRQQRPGVCEDLKGVASTTTTPAAAEKVIGHPSTKQEMEGGGVGGNSSSGGGGGSRSDGAAGTSGSCSKAGSAGGKTPTDGEGLGSVVVGAVAEETLGEGDDDASPTGHGLEEKKGGGGKEKGLGRGTPDSSEATLSSLTRKRPSQAADSMQKTARGRRGVTAT